MQLKMVLTLIVLALVGCAPTLTPRQEYTYKAVEECLKTGLQGDWTYAVGADGSLRFEGRADGFSPVKECLKQKGFRFE